MKIEDADILSDVFMTVAQQQAFIFSDKAQLDEADFPIDATPLMLGVIGFQGPCSGTIKMSMPESVCDLIADNILGLEEGSAKNMRDEAKDVIAELLNVLCGQFLTAVEGDKPVFNLSVPQISIADEAHWNYLRGKPGCRAVFIEDSPVLLCLEL